MAQHDYIISNGTGAAVRSDLNGALGATVSNNSGATEPATMYAYQWWPDTTSGLLKQRNSANNAWITIGTLASTNLGLLSLAGGTMTGVLAAAAGTAALPGISFASDLDTGCFRSGANALGFSTNGVARLSIDSVGDSTFSGNVILSGTGYIDVPSGTTAERPASPNNGMIRFNTTLSIFEGYKSAAWGAIGGAGATGGGSDEVFYENGQTITTSYTLTASKNAMSAGPVTINSSVTVTVPSGASWVVV